MAPETATNDAQNPNPTSNSTPELQNASNGEMSIYHEPQNSDDIDSSCSTPYVSAPSSPGRGSGSAGFFYSAPASPMHFALCTMPSPSTFTAASSTDAEFEFSARLACCGDSAAATSTMISADELFLNGQIRPMKLSTHLQRPQPLAPLPDTDTETDDGDGDRGRDPRLRARSLRRRTRSLSPLRQSPHHWNDHDEEHKNDPVSATKNSETASFSSSSNRSSKRWIFLKDFLYRSKSEGSSNSHSPTHSHKSWSFTHVKAKKTAARKEAPAVPAGKRRVAAASPGEAHYTAKRAQAEELRKRTFLPYKQGLLGCLGFSHRGYGLARALNPVSSR